MNVTKSAVTKYLITEVSSLDSITVYIEDFRKGMGKITITCCDECWSHAWYAMGDEYDMRRFFMKCDYDYLVGKLAPKTKKYVTDFTKIEVAAKKAICELRKMTDISKDVARDLWDYATDNLDDACAMDNLDGDKMYDIFGDEWWRRLPQEPNYDYEYLCRIVGAVKEAFQEAGE